MKADFWGLLHDSGIEAISRAAPSLISVEISIRYLRQQFPGGNDATSILQLPETLVQR